MIKITF